MYCLVLTKKLLDLVNIIKKKRYGKIKGITCANGSKQKRHLIEGESIAPMTVMIKTLFNTLIIEIYEERYVATFDVPGEYLHAKMPEGKTIL